MRRRSPQRDRRAGWRGANLGNDSVTGSSRSASDQKAWLGREDESLLRTGTDRLGRVLVAARKPARCYRSGDLAAVWVSDEGREAVRDRVRARGAAKQDPMQARPRLRKYRLRSGQRLASRSPAFLSPLHNEGAVHGRRNRCPEVCWKRSVGCASRPLSDSRTEHRCVFKGCGHPHCQRMRVDVINSEPY